MPFANCRGRDCLVKRVVMDHRLPRELERKLMSHFIHVKLKNDLHPDYGKNVASLRGLRIIAKVAAVVATIVTYDSKRRVQC